MSDLKKSLSLTGNGIGDFGETINDPQNDIKEIKNSINKLTRLVDQINREQNPSYWSIVRKESIEFWNFSKNQRQFYDKGWICDIDYQDCKSNLLIGHIKKEFGPGEYDIILCDDVGKSMSTRSIEIPIENAKKETKVELGTWLPRTYIAEDSNAPIFSNKTGKDVLSFSQHSNEKVSFSSKLEKSICGPISVNLFWSTTSWREGVVEWVISFQAKNSEDELIHYSEIYKSEPTNYNSNNSESIILDIPGKFLEGTPVRIIISRCSESAEDTFDEEADLFCVTADALEAFVKRRVIKKTQSDIAVKIANELRDSYEDDYYDIDGVIDIIVQRLEESINLKIKGGFVDLCLLAEDFNLEQNLIVKIAKMYLKYKRGFFKNKMDIKKLNLADFGEVYILKKKRWDWF